MRKRERIKSPREKNSPKVKKTAKKIFGISIILFTAVTIVLILLNNQKGNSTDDEATTLTTEQSGEIISDFDYSLENDSENGFLKYTDSKISYSFRYPKNLLIKDLVYEDDTGVHYGLYQTQDELDRSSWDNVTSLFNVSVFYQIDITEILSDQLAGKHSKYGELTEFLDLHGRKWTVSGPGYGYIASATRSEAKIGNYYFLIVLAIDGNNYGNYLGRDLFLKQGESYDWSPLLEVHDSLYKDLINSFVVEEVL